MTFFPGTYLAKKKNGDIYYRASITHKGKHISLGSFTDEESAYQAYQLSTTLLSDLSYTLDSFTETKYTLPFDKWVILINFRDNGIYFKTPIYLKKRFFLYYIDHKVPLKFAVDDLFYYANHKIMKRGGHLFVADFGMQVNILSRYGIKNFAVSGRDYLFMNGDSTDFRYENISIINKYHGVQQIIKKGFPYYLTKIHINGDYIVGTYPTETEAAIAYNKAAEILIEKGIQKKFTLNFIDDLNSQEYHQLYCSVKLSKKIQLYKST